MKNFIWLVVGVAAGFVVAHEVNKTQQGKQFFSDLDAKAREFGEAMSDGYRQREAELRDALGDSDAPAAPSAASAAHASAPSASATSASGAEPTPVATSTSTDVEADDAAFDAAAEASAVAESAADSK